MDNISPNQVSGLEKDDVLGRLHALLNRDKVTSSASAEFTLQAEEKDVPLLTDIYVPTVAGNLASQVEGEVEREQLVREMLPVLMDMLGQALMDHAKPALDQAISQALEDMKPRIEAALQQRLMEKER